MSALESTVHVKKYCLQCCRHWMLRLVCQDNMELEQRLCCDDMQSFVTGVCCKESSLDVWHTEGLVTIKDEGTTPLQCFRWNATQV